MCIFLFSTNVLSLRVIKACISGINVKSQWGLEMNLSIVVRVAVLLACFAAAGCMSMKNVGIVYTNPVEPSAAFNRDLERCQALSSTPTIPDNLLRHLLMEFIDSEHFFSITAALCMEASGWEPDIELIATPPTLNGGTRGGF